MIHKQQTFSFRADLTTDEHKKVNNYLDEMRKVGRVTIAKSEAIAAVFLTALANPEVSEKIREYIRKEFK
jgi:hypothetical protein